ncbi:MAG: acyl-CoA dehydrogenase family protein, partial [Rhodospirillales bacterium]|nr:acyl-CoA dehydrogenase family protein [Rhodospirillales bacterium]
MGFELSDKVSDLRDQVSAFMDEEVYPVEDDFFDQLEKAKDSFATLPLMDDLKAKAKAAGLWNLFLPESDLGAGLTNLEYAPLAEAMGRSLIGPEAFNCSAPDTGNMETLHRYGSDAQKKRWLAPLLDGKIRSAFCMTEPAVASSDATNIETSIRRDGDDYVINGHKWFASGIMNERCELFIVMGKTDPDAPKHIQ